MLRTECAILIAPGPIVTTNIAGKDREDDREEDLHRRLRGLLPRVLTTYQPDLRGLHTQHFTDRHAELVGLQQCDDEAGQLPDVGAAAQELQRLAAVDAELDLAKHPSKLVAERAVEPVRDDRRAPARGRGPLRQ